ncbi:hypothetical protein D3C78_1941500 [compost metagenome]
MIADRQRHRWTDDLDRGAGGGDEGVVDRKGDDDDADHQHKVTDEIGDGTFFNHRRAS